MIHTRHSPRFPKVRLCLGAPPIVPKWMNAVNVVRDGMRLRHLMFIHLCTHTTALLVSRSPHTLHK